MKKFKSVWVLGICAAVFLGPLGTQDLLGQPQWEQPVPAIDREPTEKWVTGTNQILEALIKRLEGMNEQEIVERFEELTKPFLHSYLRFPMIEQDSGNKLGWAEVIWALKEIAPRFVRCEVSRIKSYPSAGQLPGKKYDYRLDITTELVLNPSNNPGIRGCGLHRTTCTPDECQ